MGRFLKLADPEEQDEDPLAGIANLFDVSVVFIVGLMISLFSIYREARRLITLGSRENRIEPAEQARAMLAEIAGAWDSIG